MPIEPMAQRSTPPRLAEDVVRLDRDHQAVGSREVANVGAVFRSDERIRPCEPVVWFCAGGSPHVEIAELIGWIEDQQADLRPGKEIPYLQSIVAEG